MFLKRRFCNEYLAPEYAEALKKEAEREAERDDDELVDRSARAPSLSLIYTYNNRTAQSLSPQFPRVEAGQQS